MGLPTGSRRRAAGLRREELAALAGISTDYLTRLEQGRATSPSPHVIAINGVEQTFPPAIPSEKQQILNALT